MHRAHRRAFLRGELHPASERARCDTRALRCPNGVSMRPGHRPVEIAAERPNRQGGPFGRRARRARVDRAERLLQLDLRALQLAGELGGEIAAAIDFVDELRARRRRARRRPPRAACAACCSLAISARRFSSDVRAACSWSRFCWCSRGAPPIDGSDRRHHPIRAAELLQIGDVEQQAHVAGAAQLVELHHARLEHGPRGCGLCLELVDLIAGIAELARDGLRRRLRSA